MASHWSVILAAAALLPAVLAPARPVAADGAVRRPAPAASVSSPERSTLPFPVPHDTSSEAVLRWRILNLPKPGLLTVAPLPLPGGVVPGPAGSGPHPALDEQLRLRLERHATDCGDEFTQLPEPEQRVEPVAPPGSSARDLARTVRVYAVVNEQGVVEFATAGDPAGPLERAAAECVRRWRFRPAIHCGHTVPVRVMVPVRFAAR